MILYRRPGPGDITQAFIDSTLVGVTNVAAFNLLTYRIIFYLHQGEDSNLGLNVLSGIVFSSAFHNGNSRSNPDLTNASSNYLD